MTNRAPVMYNGFINGAEKSPQKRRPKMAEKIREVILNGNYLCTGS